MGPFPIGSSNIYHQYTPNVSTYTSTMDPSWVSSSSSHDLPIPNRLQAALPVPRWAPSTAVTLDSQAWTPQLVPVVRLLAAGGGGGAQVGWRCGALDDGWGMFRGDMFIYFYGDPL